MLLIIPAYMRRWSGAHPLGNRRGTAEDPEVSRFGAGGGAGGPEPKKLLRSLAEFGAHGSYYTWWENDCQNGGND
jgi:hypothetical protein